MSRRVLLHVLVHKFYLPAMLFHPVWALKRDGVCVYIYDNEEKNEKGVVAEVVEEWWWWLGGGSRL